MVQILNNFQLSDRELSIVIWVSLFILVSCLKSKGVVISILKLIKAFLNYKIQIFFWIMQGLSFAIVCFLYNLDAWEWASLKDMVWWSIGTAFIIMKDVSKTNNSVPDIRKIAIEFFSLATLITFVSNFYTFGLIFELVSFPILFCIGLWKICVEYNKIEDVPEVGKLFNIIIAIYLIVLFSYGLFHLVSNYRDYQDITFVISFILPFVLSLVVIPVMLGLMLFIEYEKLFYFLSIPYCETIKEYAFWRALTHFKWNLKKLQRWQADVRRIKPRKYADVDFSIRAMEERIAKEINLPGLVG